MLITTGFQPLFQGTFTQGEIEKGYAPTRNDWPEVITDPAQFAKLLRKRELVSYGGYAAVYEVDGAAIKIGCIAEDEAQAQQWIYETYERALRAGAHLPWRAVSGSVNSFRPHLDGTNVLIYTPNIKTDK
jgi:hypothetical protein